MRKTKIGFNEHDNLFKERERISYRKTKMHSTRNTSRTKIWHAKNNQKSYKEEKTISL